MSDGPTLELWFNLASNYTYLTLLGIEPLAREVEVSVRWEPFLLGPTFETFGWKSSPFVLQQEKDTYVWNSPRPDHVPGTALPSAAVSTRAERLRPVALALLG